MKTRGLDRVAILVRDLDQSQAFFSEVLGLELTECRGPQLEAGGVRIAMSFDQHLELVAPVLPLREGSPELVRRMAAALDQAGSDALLFGLTFRVDDADRTQQEAEAAGLAIPRRFDEASIPELGVRDLREIFLDPSQSLGLNIGLVSFETGSG
jgi:catechol 2,3-dioxygenase-like lactoylglutathione lyase family enzyme